MKLDDLGDALLHALNELLCGGSNYRQLVPASSSLQCNRSVVVAVHPNMTYWAALHVTWNKYELLDLAATNLRCGTLLSSYRQRSRQSSPRSPITYAQPSPARLLS